MIPKLSVPLLAVMLVLTSCGGGDDPPEGGSGDPTTTAAPVDVTAELEVLEELVEHAPADGSLAPAASGDVLRVGDRVHAAETGFGEITFADGSLLRVAADTEVTLQELTETEAGQAVVTSMGVGATWARVAELTESGDAFELQTPVGTAAVRGTAFAVECTDEDSCTFTVVDGTIEVTPNDGEPFEIEAVGAATVTSEGAPVAADVSPSALDANEWIRTNLALDSGDAAASAEPSADDLAMAVFDGSYTFTGTVTVAENIVGESVGDVVTRTWTVSADCTVQPCKTVLTRETTTGNLTGDVTFADGTYTVVVAGVPGDCLREDGSVATVGGMVRDSTITFRATDAVREDGRWVATAATGELVMELTPQPTAPDCSAGHEEVAYEGVRNASVGGDITLG